MNLFKAKSFKREFLKEAKLLIIVTVGFSIAFTWRQTMFDASISLVQKFFHIQGTVEASIAASALITFIGLIVILLTSRYFQGDPY